MTRGVWGHWGCLGSHSNQISLCKCAIHLCVLASHTCEKKWEQSGIVECVTQTRGQTVFSLDCDDMFLLIDYVSSCCGQGVCQRPTHGVCWKAYPVQHKCCNNRGRACERRKVSSVSTSVTHASPLSPRRSVPRRFVGGRFPVVGLPCLDVQTLLPSRRQRQFVC